MRITDAGFPFRQESVTDAFVTLWGSSGAFAFLATKEHEDGLWHDCGWAVFRSRTIFQIKHGHPNDEALPGHKLWEHGLSELDIAEVHESPWIDEIKEVNKVEFPGAGSEGWRCRHHIFALKEVTLEVLWNDFEWELQDAPFEAVRDGILGWLPGNK